MRCWSSPSPGSASKASTTSASGASSTRRRWQFRLRRLTGSGDVWVGEVSISYDGGPLMLGISVHEFRGERIARERIYVTEPWDAPEWRARWRAATPAE